jgi:hypothetical protein
VGTNRTPWALLALLAAACGGAEETAAPDPLLDEAGNPVPAAPAGGPRALPAQGLADVDTVIHREVFTYGGGPRDPFVPLINATTTGPAVGDLELAAIYYIPGNPSLTAAVLREKVSGRRYTVRTGQRLGNLYVASISEQDIWFTLDDFGVQRRESLTLRKQEDDFR